MYDKKNPISVAHKVKYKDNTTKRKTGQIQIKVQKNT